MNTEEFINEAIKLGSQFGLSALNPLQRKVFLISEAEVSCDMNGIESFIDQYESSILLEVAEAFFDVGAGAIASGLREIAQSLPSNDEGLFDRVNDLICNRSGYDWDSIARYIVCHT